MGLCLQLEEQISTDIFERWLDEYFQPHETCFLLGELETLSGWVEGAPEGCCAIMWQTGNLAGRAWMLVLCKESHIKICKNLITILKWNSKKVNQASRRKQSAEDASFIQLVMVCAVGIQEGADFEKWFGIVLKYHFYSLNLRYFKREAKGVR